MTADISRPPRIAVAARPFPGEAVSGDAWTVQSPLGEPERADADPAEQGLAHLAAPLPFRFRLAVVDGLGHGPGAASAAAAAVAALEGRPDLDCVAAIHTCHDALRGTRGAALAVSYVDCLQGRLTFAGVGNVEAWLWRPGGTERPISYRGIVGSALPTVRPFELHLGPEWLLVMHTDGVSARFDPPSMPAFRNHDPRALADALLAAWGRDADDATVVVVDARSS